uniref:DUF4200 domain-containing protein n=1 Tax=Syphacia muris TaxID=451379 RepID=A0A0N5A8W4_9BILA
MGLVLDRCKHQDIRYTLKPFFLFKKQLNEKEEKLDDGEDSTKLPEKEKFEDNEATPKIEEDDKKKVNKTSVDLYAAVRFTRITVIILQEYISLEKYAHRCEQKSILKKLEKQTILADNVKKTLDQLEATFKELKKQTDKEKADVDNMEQPTVRSFLKQQGTWSDRYNKEHSEYLEALNKQEIAEKEMNAARKQYDRAARIAEIYKQQCDKLREVHEKQNKILVSLFGSDYASEKETRLETELEDTTEWQQRVSLAKFKWTNGRVLLVHACTQMAFGITRWKGLEKIDPENTRMRYFAAAEARNNFIAAGQNVQSCRIYLGKKVKFPYCTEEEMEEMDRTINLSFNDIQSNATLKKALTVYKHTHKKVAALVQWFDKVINETILKDLEKADDEIVKKQRQLREERLRFLKKHCKEIIGKELKFEYEDDKIDELDKELLALESEKDTENEENGKQLTEILNLSQPNGKDPASLNQSQLAPIPDKDALFGDVKQKLDEYGSIRKEIEKRNLLEREKQEIELQEKIKLRSQNGRRARKSKKSSTTENDETESEKKNNDE